MFEFLGQDWKGEKTKKDAKNSKDHKFFSIHLA